MKPRTTLWLIIGLIVLSLFVILPPLPTNPTWKIPHTNITLAPANWFGKFPLKLGLDLQGGTQMTLGTDMSKIASQNRDAALQSARDVIERRVNLFGVSEAVVQTSQLGDQRRIIVDLPGITDASEAANLVGKTAQLDFREFPATLSASEATSSSQLDYTIYKPTGLTGADLKQATVTYSNTTTNTGPEVAITFTGEGAKKFDEITKRNVGKPLGMFLDGTPISWPPPTVSQEIIDGNAVISGNFTADQAKELATQLNAGALPVPISILQEQSIGATLGQQSINKSVIAGVIGILTVMIYMGVYYGWLGLVADFALIVYSLFVLAIFKTGLFIIPPITLTLAGIAGFILSIGMAVDANILIFERMKEERRWGKSFKGALDLGFKRAWSSIRDSNVSSLITAAILYTIGTGPVRGFAVALAIGVIVSMFTAITVTRTVLRLLITDKGQDVRVKNQDVKWTSRLGIKRS